MSLLDDQTEVQALLKKVTKEHRRRLKKLWKEIEELEAAVQSAEKLRAESKRIILN